MRLGVGRSSSDSPAPLLMEDAWDIPFQRGPAGRPIRHAREASRDSVDSFTFSFHVRRQRIPSKSLQTAANISSHSRASRLTVSASRSGYSTVR